MGSVTDSVGSGRSNVRRYSSIQTRLERWNNGNSNGELPPMLPRLQKIRTQVARTPALDLAQQAQLAACNYLGYSPRDLPNDVFRPQGLPSDSHRPLELHMHHFHHHYVASPTSPFSQTSSQCCEAPGGEIPGPPTTELALRVASPVPANTTTTTTVYPTALGLRGPSVGPQLMHTLQGRVHVQNPSQSVLNGPSVGDVEAAHRYMENILWLKNQIGHGPDQVVDHWKDRRGETVVGSERRIMGSEPRPPISTSERRPIRRAKKIFRPRDDTPDSTSDMGVPCCRKTRPKTPSDSALLLEKCEKMRAIQNQNSPCNSLSDDSLATDDSGRPESLPAAKCQRSPPNCIKMRNTKMIENGEKSSTIENSNQKMSLKPQDTVRPAGCVLSPWRLLPRGRDQKSRRGRSLREETTSSLEHDSVCSAGKVSVTHKSTWTCTSSSTDSDNGQRERSPPGRPAKKGCGARASRQQASKEAKAWDTVEIKQRKISSYRPDARPEASVQPMYEYEYEVEFEIDSESKPEEKDLEDRNNNVPEEVTSLQDRCTEEKERGDAKEFRAQRLGSQTRAQTEIETSKKTWNPPVGSDRGPRYVSVENDSIGEDEATLDEEQPHCCFPSRTNENRTGDYNSSHNRLRDAVEAAWNTNLGTKNGLGDYYAKTCPGHKCSDLHNLRDQVVREESFHSGLLENALCPFSGEGKAHTCEETWKASLGTKKGVEEDCRNTVPGDPTFQKAYRDHENLKALVAREENLQRELKDQTVARVAAEERARAAAEQKAHIYEASAKAAEEGLRVLLDERTLFHSKFKEELETGATDRLRLQELLHLEKLKLEATESELRQVRRSSQDSLAVGTKAALPTTKTLLQPDPNGLDGLSVHAVGPHGLRAGHDEAHLQLRVESESRIRAETRASHFEATAKAAEERLRSLLDERNWFYAKFKEELEQNNTDMKKLQQLMELEKSNNRHEDPPQKRRPDLRSQSVPNLPKTNLHNKTEDGQGARHSEVHYKASFRSKRDEELHPEDKDRHRLDPSSEFKEPPGERWRCCHRPEAEISDFKQADDCCGEDQMSVSSVDTYENREVRYVRGNQEKSSMKNEKKRPLPPIDCSRVVGLQRKSPERPLSLKIERCNNRRDGEATTVLDISPGGSRLDSVDLHFRETPESPNDCQSAADNSFKETAVDRKKPAGPVVENSADRSRQDGGPLMALPSKWKKETKAELRKMIQEQEMTWKIAEDAVEELRRRLELLERYKMKIQDTLGRTRAMGNIDGLFKHLKENLEDFPRGFNSLYNSPIYEEAKALYNCPIFTQRKEGRVTGKIPCKDVCTSPTRPDVSKDSEIKNLKDEIAQLRVELRQRDTKRAESPQSKSASPSSPPSLRLSPPPPLEVPDWSTNFLSGFETPSLRKEDTSPLPLIALGNQNTPEVNAEDMEPELQDSSFEELKTITLPARQDSSKEYSNGKVDQFERIDVYTSRTIELEVDDRRWVPISDDRQDKTAAPACMGNGICQAEKMDYQERNGPQEDILLSIDLNSDEGELRILKTAVRKLSRIFWEQEEKLKDFKQREKKSPANISQTEDLRDLYLHMLKEMSQQLGELCHELHATTRPDEALQNEERTPRKCDPLEKIAQKFQSMEMMNSRGTTKPSKDLQVTQKLQIKNEKTTLSPIEKLDSGAKQTLKEKSENIMSETDLRAALKAAENRIEEQKSTNLLLTEKLDSGSQYLSKLQAEHAQEVARRDHSIDYAQHLNLELSTDMTQTETSMAEIKSRYRTLVSNLEQQLEEAKQEAICLQETVSVLKEEIEGKEHLVSGLEAEAKEYELQLVQLKSQLQTIQDERNANVREKIELVNSLEAMRREADVEQHRVTELIRINEDLIAFSESKEDEEWKMNMLYGLLEADSLSKIRELTTTLKSLQRSANEKSAEAEKLSAEALAFSQEVVETRKEGDTYRLRCAALKSKVEEVEYELVAREASMERLTKHLGTTIEGQDFILEEKEQLLLSLNRAQYKEHRLDDQVRQSKIIIQDLEEKLNSMDAEINEARLEMAEMKAKGLEASLIEKQAGEMRNRVHELEEEIMEKEGQISILKTSYPGEYTSTF